MSRFTVIVAAVAAMLAIPPSAFAHIDISPQTAAPGTRATFVLTVPNERSKVATVAVAVRLPDGVAKPTATSADGWKATLANDGGHPVLRWSGGTITGEGSATFRFTVTLPNVDAAQLTFPATQTYANGEIDRWIESTDAERPAPLVTLTSRDGAATSSDPSNSGRAGWLIGGTLAALVALGALATGRRDRRSKRRPTSGTAGESDAD